MKKLQLSTEEKDFFQKVRQAIFTNPFSDERNAVDSQLIQARPSPNREKHIQRLVQVVNERIRQICPGGHRSIFHFQKGDQKLIQYGMLFHIFHKYCSAFDAHIEEQIERGDSPCKVNFAGQVLGEMIAMGMERPETIRLFSLFFQIRRAFHFIDLIVGMSPCIKDLRRNLWNNIFTHDIQIYDQHLCNRMEDFSTMLLGGTGTGKGLAASAIGRSGYIPFDEKKIRFTESFTKVFVSINLSQYPEQLLESELFGHTKGAFTGAIDSHNGILTLCSSSGAIFLDEIGEVTIPVQIKLLQVLQERLFSPVGSHKKERFYGRVIAATNRSINELRAQKLFRDDFYYRLCSDIIEVPPLSQRILENPNELDQLLAHTVNRIIGKPSEELLHSTLQIIRKQVPDNYPWPGNVRELEQCVRRILLKQEYKGDTLLTGEDRAGKLTAALQAGNYTARELLSSYCKLLYEKLGTYGSVANVTELDRRTVKKYIDSC